MANKKRVRKVKPVDSDLGPVDLNEEEPTQLPKNTQVEKSISELDDSQLITELKRRKQKELDKLLADNKDIVERINKLKAILEL